MPLGTKYQKLIILTKEQLGSNAPSPEGEKRWWCNHRLDRCPELLNQPPDVITKITMPEYDKGVIGETCMMGAAKNMNYEARPWVANGKHIKGNNPDTLVLTEQEAAAIPTHLATQQRRSKGQHKEEEARMGHTDQTNRPVCRGAHSSGLAMQKPGPRQPCTGSGFRGWYSTPGPISPALFWVHGWLLQHPLPQPSPSPPPHTRSPLGPAGFGGAGLNCSPTGRCTYSFSSSCVFCFGGFSCVGALALPLEPLT